MIFCGDCNQLTLDQTADPDVKLTEHMGLNCVLSSCTDMDRSWLSCHYRNISSRSCTARRRAFGNISVKRADLDIVMAID